MTLPPHVPSREISRINFDIATKHGVKISIVAELRRKLKDLLFQTNQSTPLHELQCKELIIEILSQEQTYAKEHKT